MGLIVGSQVAAPPKKKGALDQPEKGGPRGTALTNVVNRRPAAEEKR